MFVILNNTAFNWKILLINTKLFHLKVKDILYICINDCKLIETFQ